MKIDLKFSISWKAVTNTSKVYGKILKNSLAENCSPCARHIAESRVYLFTWPTSSLLLSSVAQNISRSL